MSINRKAVCVSALYLSTFALITTASAATVSTGQYDSYRSGANVSETILTTANVNATTFGRIGAYAVDGQVFAQPLYIPGLKINGVLTNVVFIATMHNSVYAFDASKTGSAPLWQTTLAPSVPAQYSGQCPGWSGGPETGILSTPVINTQTGTLYAVYATTSGPDTYAFYIAALDILTGQHKAASPALITASVPGSGYDNVGGTISFNPLMQAQRTALTLANGVVYAGFGSCSGDIDPYHGWVIGYSAANVSVQTSALNTTPDGGEGGVWQSGRGMAVDAAGNLYAATGNGTDDTTDMSESVIVQVGSNGKETGVYTDPNAALLNQNDTDLGAGGPLYIGSLGLLVAGGKEGVIHVLNPAQFGSPGGPLVQSFVATQQCVNYAEGCYELNNSLAYWDTPANPLLYVWGAYDVLRAYRWSGGAFNTTPDSVGTMTLESNAPALALSSNGSDPATAVLWAVTLDGYLHAYQATNVAREIYNSGENPTRDSLGNPTHFIEPVVADGQVYVATLDDLVQVYGLVSSPQPGSATAAFLKADTTTQGNWRAGYGADGYVIEADQSSNPSYAAPAVSGALTYTWANPTTDVRALQKASNPSDRIAATWYSGSSFTIDSNISDQAPHQVAIYCVDWDPAERSQLIDVLDDKGNVLDSETLGAFANGVYLIWNVSGHVVFRVTLAAGSNAVVSGIFFGGAAVQQPPSASAKFVATDTTTEGNWRTAYGADGYNIEADQSLNPGYAAPVITGALTYTWVPSTSDVRALQKASNPSDRVAATWYASTSFTIDTGITDQNQHQVALYCIDWGPQGRQQTIQVLDTNNNILDTENMASFPNGAYMVWNVTGRVIFRVTLTGGPNAVVSGIFFGGGVSQPPPGASASFVKADSATQGNWRSAYGADGYNIEADLSLNPGYAAPVIGGESNYTWLDSTTDPRALQKASNSSDRIAATWYSETSFTIDSNISDQNQHQVALYCIDWGPQGRQQTIQVLDTNGNILDTETMTSFAGGTYMVWNVTGHAVFRVTTTSGPNAVVSGIFFGGPLAAPTASATFVKADTTTQGNWLSVYGAGGYSIEGDLTSNPAYAMPVFSGAQTYTWQQSTTDVRALQKASNPGDRIAATWYSQTSFSLDSGITDHTQHQIALYSVDWENGGRQAIIQVLDAGGNVLDSRTLSNFSGGVYMVWNVTGHVTFRITVTAGYTGVVSGIFYSQ